MNAIYFVCSHGAHSKTMEFFRNCSLMGFRPGWSESTITFTSFLYYEDNAFIHYFPHNFVWVLCCWTWEVAPCCFKARLIVCSDQTQLLNCFLQVQLKGKGQWWENWWDNKILSSKTGCATWIVWIWNQGSHVTEVCALHEVRFYVTLKLSNKNLTAKYRHSIFHLRQDWKIEINLLN